MTSSSLPEDVSESAPAAPAPAASLAVTHEIEVRAKTDDFFVYRPRVASAPVEATRQEPPSRAPSAPGVELGLSLREAASLVGASKSTILRAIQSGRLAAPKTEDGSYAIHKVALYAAFPPKSVSAIAGQAGDAASAPPAARAERANGTDSGARALAARMAALEVEINNLKSLLAEARRPAQPWWRRMVG